MNTSSPHWFSCALAGLLMLWTAHSHAQQPAAKRPLPQLSVDLNSLTYPGAPQRAGLQGRVLVAFTITNRGKADNIEIVSAEPAGEFDATATRALRQVQFTVPRDWRDSGGEAQRFQLSVLFKLSPCAAPCVAPQVHEGADDFLVISAQAR